MNPYSLDIRERVLAKVLEGETSQADVAEDFAISAATVENWLRVWRETASLAPKPFGGGAPRTLQACEAVIRHAVQQQPDATLQELCEIVEAQTGVHASPSVMCRELQLHDLPRKKVAARHSARHTARASAAASLSRPRPRQIGTARRASQIHR